MTAETRDPERILPKAINALPLRIIIFLSAVDGGDYCRGFMAGRLAGCQSVRDPVRQGRATCRRRGDKLCRLDVSHVVGEQRRLFQYPHAVRPVGGKKHAHWQFRILSRNTRIPVRSLLFSLLLHAKRYVTAVPGAKRDDVVHHRFNAGGDHGGFQLGYDPRGVPGVSP